MLFFFLSNLTPIFFIVIFFTFAIILNYFFSISSFKIKLFWNWVSWLSLNLVFHELQVLEINSSLKDLLRLSWFLFFIFKFMFSFSFKLQHLFNRRLDYVIIIIFFIESFTNFKNNMGYLGSFFFFFILCWIYFSKFFPFSSLMVYWF
jgi:hypothetical protein